MTGSPSVPVNDFGRLPTQGPLVPFQIGVSDHAAKLVLLFVLSLKVLARPNVTPTSWISMNGREQGAAGTCNMPSRNATVRLGLQ